MATVQQKPQSPCGSGKTTSLVDVTNNSSYALICDPGRLGLSRPMGITTTANAMHQARKTLPSDTSSTFLSLKDMGTPSERRTAIPFEQQALSICMCSIHTR